MDGVEHVRSRRHKPVLPLLRGAFVAALFSAFGASLFIQFVAP